MGLGETIVLENKDVKWPLFLLTISKIDHQT